MNQESFYQKDRHSAQVRKNICKIFSCTQLAVQREDYVGFKKDKILFLENGKQMIPTGSYEFLGILFHVLYD